MRLRRRGRPGRRPMGRRGYKKKYKRSFKGRRSFKKKRVGGIRIGYRF